MKNQIQKSAKSNKNITLTGMMGVGKTTIGKALSKRLKIKLIDIDKIIEYQESTTINRIYFIQN